MFPQLLHAVSLRLGDGCGGGALGAGFVKEQRLVIVFLGYAANWAAGGIGGELVGEPCRQCGVI